jgi:signal peptidase I
MNRNLDEKQSTSTWRPIKAVLLSLLMPGLGQIYNGDFTKGIIFFGLFAGAVPLFSRIAVNGPVSALWIFVVLGAMLAFGIFIVSVVNAYRSAQRTKTIPEPKEGGGPHLLLAFLLFGYLFVLSPSSDNTREHVVELFRVPTASMSPAVEEGDYVFVDKRIHSDKPPFTVHRGDIAVFIYPNDRTRTYIKRVAALPGEEIQVDKENIRVPNGYIFVLGDNRDNAEDSRRFGPVPLSDVIGVARQVWFNSKTASIFDRLGKSVSRAD